MEAAAAAEVAAAGPTRRPPRCRVVTATILSAWTASLSWPPSIDDSGSVASYGLYFYGTFVRSLTDTSVTLDHLACSGH